VIAALAVAVSLAATPAPASAERPEALLIERGAVASHQIVALGRDIVVEGEALEGLTALDGSARISGTVAGEVTVLGGDALLAPNAIVRGDVHVLGGRISMAPGARIEGRAIAYPTISRAWTTLLEGPSLGLDASSPIVVAAKLGLVAAWLAVTLVLFAAGGRGLASASDEIRREPLLCFASGLVAVLAALLTTLLLSEVAPTPLALPLIGLLVFAAIAARLWGVVALFHALGRALLGLFGRRRQPALHAAVVGLVVLALAKFVPYVGVVAWGAATFVGVGAALRTHFGRLPDSARSTAELLAPAP
jgi:hypothetical protein